MFGVRPGATFDESSMPAGVGAARATARETPLRAGPPKIVADASPRAKRRRRPRAAIERRGACRDYAHLALAFCRCINIPARYCTGYISDIGLPPPNAPQDFGASIEVFMGDRWHMFDPRNNGPRIGRILVARGRDAADVPIDAHIRTLTFGPSALVDFRVTTEEANAK
jgi:transglutaminase-like putative cysteine protease